MTMKSGPTPASTDLELFGEDMQVQITMTFRTEQEAKEVYEHFVSAIEKRGGLTISASMPARSEKTGDEQ